MVFVPFCNLFSDTWFFFQFYNTINCALALSDDPIKIDINERKN